jgi:multimeric flavodoxin WrbA
MDDKLKRALEAFYGEWSEIPEISEDMIRKQHAVNTQNCKHALKHFHKKDRKLEVLVIHGSPRSAISCPQELSNSQALLRYGMEAIPPHANVEEVNLRDYNISPCNGCVSSTSALCNFPCSCFPFDPMQKLYPKVLKCDVLLISTGVNQSMVSTRLKAFLDRLISLDGGYFIEPEQMGYKTPEFKARAVEISKNGAGEYNQRMFGRVAAYFISSKDQDNPMPPTGWNYGKTVAEALYHSNADYGIHHAEPYYVIAASNPFEDYSHDKYRLHKNKEAQDKAKEVVLKALELAKKFRKEGYPEFKPGRYNRT